MSAASNPYEGLQEWVAGLPDVVQPLAVAAAAMIPYVEGEGSAALGVIVGIHPVVAALAGIVGNMLSVVLVVLLGQRARRGVLSRRSRRAEQSMAGTPAASGARSGTARGAAVAVAEPPDDESSDDESSDAESRPASKGRKRLERWLVRFGVPGAALLGPLALPTQLTAATFVASGAPRAWVLLWTFIAIVVWTTAITAATTGIVSLVGW